MSATNEGASRGRRAVLVVGVIAWLVAIALTPGELDAARKRERIGARTGVALACYVVAALLVLAGLPRRPTPPELPRS